MATVAVITDIHGNLPALEAALARGPSREVAAAGLPDEFAEKLLVAA